MPIAHERLYQGIVVKEKELYDKETTHKYKKLVLKDHRDNPLKDFHLNDLDQIIKESHIGGGQFESYEEKVRAKRERRRRNSNSQKASMMKKGVKIGLAKMFIEKMHEIEEKEAQEK